MRKRRATSRGQHFELLVRKIDIVRGLQQNLTLVITERKQGNAISLYVGIP